MNERIKQLAEQTMNSDKAPHLSEELYCFTKSEFEKFVEFVIRECAYIPIDMWDKAELNADIAVKIEDRIKHHFGVE